MAIYRCSKCSFVCEDLVSPTGTKVSCAKCGTVNTLFATAFYVEKLVERYLAARRELEALKSEDNQDEEAAPNVAATPEQPNPLKDDLHNTNALATTEQHQPLDAWFAAKQIKATFDPRSVDTTGFFDEAAKGIGDRYEFLSGAIEQIRFAYRKDHSWLNIELGKKEAKEAQEIQAFFRQLYSHTFFSRYSYKKQTKTLGLALQPAQTIRAFFEGGWLEWYVFINLLTLCLERNREFSCARGVKIAFQNDELRELDVAFLIGKRNPIVVECKSGEFRGEIEKYVKLRRRLGIDKERFIICSAELTNEQVTGLTAMYELTFVNLSSLKSHLSIAI